MRREWISNDNPVAGVKGCERNTVNNHQLLQNTEQSRGEKMRINRFASYECDYFILRFVRLEGWM